LTHKQEYGGFLANLNAYLEGKYGEDSGSSRAILSRSEFEDTLTAGQRNSEFIDYVFGIIDGVTSESVQQFISQSPVRFVCEYADFVSKLVDTKGNNQTKKIRAPFYNALANDFLQRPESALLNREQLGTISDAEDKFNKMHGTKGVARRMHPSDLKGKLDQLCVRILNEHYEKIQDRTDHSHLMALDSLIHYTKSQNVFDSANIEQLITLYEQFVAQRSAQEKQQTNADMFSGELLASREVSNQIEGALISKLMFTPTSDISEGWVNRLKKLNQGKGAKPNSFGLNLLQVICRISPKESEDSSWWDALKLSEIIEVFQANQVLKLGIVAAAAEGEWFRKTVEQHVSEADSLPDLAVAIQANTIFGAPATNDLIRVWKSASARSEVLRDIQANLVSAPVENTRLLGESLLSKQSEAHQLKLNSLNEEIESLKATVTSLETAMQRGQANLGETKVGLEQGVTRKFGEAVARLIRRMEREAGKTHFNDILAKEANGLSRLGMTILPANTTQPFDPSRHDSIGTTIELGANVTIIETGLLLLLGKDTITVLKAVVHPAN
jgi:hypothetical protein